MKKKIRCAIYTRKSSEEGLDQDFNSLDAQREAYVASQKHEGWVLLPELYDDGGISGGTLARPALQRLLSDLDEGRVDQIVVYKIDRLSRSLADFAKIVDRLNGAEASFVSVTQSFNTATSMGRLGLSDEILATTKRCCGAVAVSAYPPYDETAETIRILSEHSIKTNVHFILDAESVDIAIDWLIDPPKFLKPINAIIFLNYKPSGRKVFEEKLLRHSDRLDEFFSLATSANRKLKVGFDACCVSGVFARTNANTSLVDACDAGRFSMYVSEDLRVYPCSFQGRLAAGDQLDDSNSLLDIWTKSENMDSFRQYFGSDRCGGCSHRSTCTNGCPLFDELVVCGNR